MQHKPEGFNRAAAADELAEPGSGSAPGGQVGGEVAMQPLELPPQVTGSGGEAADRLEKRTHFDTPTAQYNIKLTNYGNGLGEIGWSFVPSITTAKSGRGLSEQRDDNEDRSIRRAKSQLRKLILSAGADHLLTLTYRENITDFNQACADFSKFIRLVRKQLPNWVYVAISEQQKRGAWHWHLAVVGRQDVELLRSCWRHVVGQGNIDVNPPKGIGIQRQLGLVKYLGKYLAKGFVEGNRKLNARRFRASQGICIPTISLSLPKEHRGDAAGYALQLLVSNVGGVGYMWRSEQAPAGWACSWR